MRRFTLKAIMPDGSKQDIQAEETVIALSSGNDLVVHCYGNDVHNDHVMVYSRSDGSGKSPMNLYLVMPDQDDTKSVTVVYDDTKSESQYDPTVVYEIKIRHRGPSDSEFSFLPKDFLNGRLERMEDI